MASIIKTDNIQKVSDDSNIIKKCGSTITIGSSGASVALASGATQTGFGRTGTVDWCTTAKTSPFTAVGGNGYFINTTSGAVTVTLPASPSAGDIVAFSDYANKWGTNAVTLCRNSSLINGGAFNTDLETNGSAITLVYVDGTRGWKQINDATENVTGSPTFIVASGGTITTDGDFKVHTFTSDGVFTICSAPTISNNNVSYMVVAGGGAGGPHAGCGGGSATGGGGGAGGFREGKTPATPYTASPLVAPTGLPISVQAYPVSIGAGGANHCHPNTTPAPSGSNSVFSTITSTGGGGGGADRQQGETGGSGGGRGGEQNPGPGAAGNTPPVSPPQGNAGGQGGFGGPAYGSGGGGGATAAGGNGSTSDSGDGGTGATTNITGSPVGYAGGGGGGGYGPGQAFGTQGGGDGTRSPSASCGAAVSTAGTANTGGGGGGGGQSPLNPGKQGSSGGSGVVVIRYKFQ
jgi:hypothetical protein